MRLLFSEASSDYSNYQFRYAVWAVPDPGDRPAQLYEHGFLRSPGEPPRYYLCRSVRVELAKFRASSENRRILRKGAELTLNIYPREDYLPSPAVKEMCLRCASERFGEGVIGEARFAKLLASGQTSHVLEYRLGERVVGLVTALFDAPEMAHYHFAFYDLDAGVPSMGMYMMTRAIVEFAERRFRYAYLGTCYSKNALYKTQFEGVEFHSGVRWSAELEELKYLLERAGDGEHLLESAEYLEQFAGGRLDGLEGLSVSTRPSTDPRPL